MSRFNPIKIAETESDSDDEYGIVEEATFPLTITKSQASAKQPKALPVKFLRRFLVPQKPKSMVLVDKDGIKTECVLLWKNIGEICCHLGMGWYEFVRTHNFVASDRLVAIPNKDGSVLHIVVQNGDT